ncbi:ABC transporter substrate-binding protein [Solidesulfovibrio sp.]
MKPILSSSPTRRPARPRPWLSPVLALVLTLGLGRADPAAAQGPVVTDDLGREVRLAAQAGRIVPLYGAFVDILGGMGLSDRVIARTEADAVPAGSPNLPVIGTHMRPNLERVLAVKPDLVLQMDGRGEARESAEQLSALGLAVAVFAVSDFPGLFATIGRIGVLTGSEHAATALTDRLKMRLAAVSARLPAGTGPRPTVFFEARSGSLLAAGQGSMVDAVITAAGGTNAVTVEKKLVRLSDEELLRLAPAVCLTQRGPMNPEASPLAGRPGYASLPCVRNGRAFIVDEARFSRPGPGSVDAVEELAGLLAAGAS